MATLSQGYERQGYHCNPEATFSTVADPLSLPSFASHSLPPLSPAFMLLQIIKQFFPAVLHSSASCKNFNVFIFAIRGKRRVPRPPPGSPSPAWPLMEINDGGCSRGAGTPAPLQQRGRATGGPQPAAVSPVARSGCGEWRIALWWGRVMGQGGLVCGWSTGDAAGYGLQRGWLLGGWAGSRDSLRCSCGVL